MKEYYDVTGKVIHAGNIVLYGDKAGYASTRPGCKLGTISKIERGIASFVEDQDKSHYSQDRIKLFGAELRVVSPAFAQGWIDGSIFTI